MLALKTKLIKVIDNEATGTLCRVSRENKGIKQIFVAKGMGLSSAYLSQLESGKREWTMERLQAFAQLIGEEIEIEAPAAL